MSAPRLRIVGGRPPPVRILDVTSGLWELVPVALMSLC